MKESTVQLIWRAVVEIPLMAVGIYLLVRFLRRTRGWPVVVGAMVLFMILLVATALLDLQVVRSLLGTSAVFIAFGMLVVFQPELRRLLAELGNLPAFVAAHEQREIIEVIIQTAERLADVRIGALLAIEQTIELRGAVESGIAVDCEATPEMLETIFFPNNAVHDGGVVIKGDRIAYAACIFPLTQRQDLHKSLGTRHRAAIGLAEETDAIVVAVSEETGAISYAHKGQLVRGVSLEELRAFLTAQLVKPGDEDRSALRWLRRFLPQQVTPGPVVITRSEPRPSPKPGAK